MPEDRLDPELLTLKELQYCEADGRWYKKTHPERSEAGAFMSLGTATSLDLSTLLTKTETLTGVGSLSSAGMKFLLKSILCYSTKKVTVTLKDGTSTKAIFAVASGANVEFRDVHGMKFSTDCRIVTTTGDVAIHVGGLRLVLQV